MAKLIVFDMEGTLIENEFLIELARLIGKEKEIKKIKENLRVFLSLHVSSLLRNCKHLMETM